MHFLQSLLKLIIFTINTKNYLLIIFLVLNAVFITDYHVKAVQDDISAKTVPIWLHQTVHWLISAKDPHPAGLKWKGLVYLYISTIPCPTNVCISCFQSCWLRVFFAKFPKQTINGKPPDLNKKSIESCQPKCSKIKPNIWVLRLDSLN